MLLYLMYIMFVLNMFLFYFFNTFLTYNETKILDCVRPPKKATNARNPQEKRFHHIISGSSEPRVIGQSSAYLRSEGRKC